MIQTDATPEFCKNNTADDLTCSKHPQYKVSLIFSCYNGEKYIPALIDNFKKQTIGFENLELIFVDDCSKDHSVDVIKSFEEKYSNIHLIRLPKNSGGASRPRNTGLEHATGRYVMFLDIDDLITLNGIEKTYEAITSYDADFVRSNVLCLSNGAYHKFSDFCKKIIKEDNRGTRYSHMGSVAVLMSRQFLMDNHLRFREIRIGEDLSFALEAYVKTRKPFYTIPDPVLIYNNEPSSDSVTHSVKTGHLLDFIDNLDDMMLICARLNKEFKKDMYANYIPLIYSFLFQLTRFEKRNVIKIFRRLNKTQNKYKRFSPAVKGLFKPAYNLISKGHYEVAFIMTKTVYLLYDTPLFIRLFRLRNTIELSKDEYKMLKDVLP